MGFDLELAASFVVLVDEWGYGRAAEALHVSGPTLTKRMQRLERQVGTRLVERGPEGLTGLTPAGLDFVRSARRLVQRANAAQHAALAARTADPARTLRFGVPAGATSVVAFLGLSAAQNEVRMAFTSLRTTLVEVPFPLINRCLVENHVDLLLTIAPVRHRAVDSIPLPLKAARMGVVSQRHALAGAGAVGVADYCEHQLLWNPTLPEEWMRPFWFGDLRTAGEARLTATHSSSNERVFQQTQRGAAAIVTLSPDRPHLPAGLEEVTLNGAEPVQFYAAKRRVDTGPVLRSYVEQLCLRPPQTLR